MAIISRDAFEPGTVVEVTESGGQSYVIVPRGFRGVVKSCGPTHATMNGGGQDVAIALDPENPQHARLSRAIIKRMRELQAEERASDHDRGYYTDSLIAYCSTRVSVRSTKLRKIERG